MNVQSFFSSFSRAMLVVSFFIGSAQMLALPSVADAQVYYSNGQYTQVDRESVLPKCTLSANPVLIDTQNRATLSWTTGQADTVFITDIGNVTPNIAGNQSVYTQGGRTYTLTASNTYGPRVCTVNTFSYGQSGVSTGPNVTTYATRPVTYQPHNQNSSYYNSGTQYAQNYNQNNNQNYQYNYGNTNGTAGYYYSNGQQYAYPVNQQYSDVRYGYQNAYQTQYTGAAYGVRNEVRLARLPYTGPLEDAVGGMFSLAVLVSSLYGMRRIVG